MEIKTCEEYVVNELICLQNRYDNICYTLNTLQEDYKLELMHSEQLEDNLKFVLSLLKEGSYGTKATYEMKSYLYEDCYNEETALNYKRLKELFDRYQ